ncbi:MAG: hypothetical protein GY875_20020, partial [Gammaproteobacteria bacterium]|nr:hypothetical protein [Gammaproteobacteria bacterium]
DIDPDSIREFSEPWEVYLKVCGKLMLQMEERVLYQEFDIPLVELAVQLSDWYSNHVQESFKYTSMESENDYLFCFNKLEGFLKFDSPYAEYYEPRKISPVVFCEAAQEFIDNLKDELFSVYQLDISDLLSGKLRI